MSSHESRTPANARKQRTRIEIYSLSLLTGILAGLVVVAYRFAISAAEESRSSFLQIHERDLTQARTPATPHYRWCRHGYLINSGNRKAVFTLIAKAYPLICLRLPY